MFQTASENCPRYIYAPLPLWGILFYGRYISSGTQEPGSERIYSVYFEGRETDQHIFCIFYVLIPNKRYIGR